MKRNPCTFFFLTAVILLGAVGVALWQLTPLHIGWIYLIAVSVIAFLFYGYDKYQAKSNGQRIPELVLHLLALTGGTIGALAGQILFRHKTRKWQFQLVNILIVLIQAGLIAWWALKQ